jgi:hypothetical protein
MTLPGLIDRKTLAKEMCLPRSVVDAIFHTLPVTRFPGCPRKVFVKRADVIELMERGTTGTPGGVVLRSQDKRPGECANTPGPGTRREP